MPSKPNLLLDLAFNTPEGYIPFGEIHISDYQPAFEHHLQIAKQKIQDILAEPHPNFDNTIAALEYLTYKTDYIYTIVQNLNSAESNPELEAVCADLSLRNTQFWNDITLDKSLFEKVSQVYGSRTDYDLSPEQDKLLQETYAFFIRNGAALSTVDKQKLREIDQELTELSVKFQQNILAETNDYQLEITDPAHLAGLPAAYLSSIEKSGPVPSWVVDLSYPKYTPFMKYAQNRELRKVLYMAYMNRGNRNNQWDTKQIIRRIASLRNERAQLLGYQTYADYIVEKRMIGSVKQVEQFLQTLQQEALPLAHREIQQLTDFAHKLDNLDSLYPYDYVYYAEKLKKQLYHFDEEQLKQYFALDKVLAGLFSMAQKLYGISFILRGDIPVYQAEVVVYEVKEANGEYIGLLYLDFFPRAGKQSGAWMTSFRSQYWDQGIEYRPQVSIVCNFSRPQQDNPALLTLQEVLTLFHEFGHSLHGLFAQGKYASLTGTSVYWDFVELPSQIMENWVYEKETLQLIAQDWQTGQALSDELIEIIKSVSSFHEGYATIRQLSFAWLDLYWHILSGENIDSLDIGEFEKNSLASLQLLTPLEGVLISPSFSHIFAGGYASGYYGYKYAEMLDADAYDYFTSQGEVFDSDIATEFRTQILSQGGIYHPMDLYKQFRGQEPRLEALMKRIGK